MMAKTTQKKKKEKKGDLIAQTNDNLDNNSIVEIYLNNGLIRTCVDMQFIKLPKTDYWKWEYKEDLYQDLIVFLLCYDNAKLNDAHRNNHMNALITRIIQNQIYSTTSKFYCNYLKTRMKTRQMDTYMENRYLGVTDEEE